MTKKEHLKLGWELLEHECRYHEFDYSTIKDSEYDALVVRWRTYAETHGLDVYDGANGRPTGWSMERPSAKLVYMKVLKEHDPDMFYRLGYGAWEEKLLTWKPQ